MSIIYGDTKCDHFVKSNSVFSYKCQPIKVCVCVCVGGGGGMGIFKLALFVKYFYTGG